MNPTFIFAVVLFWEYSGSTLALHSLIILGGLRRPSGIPWIKFGSSLCKPYALYNLPSSLFLLSRQYIMVKVFFFFFKKKKFLKSKFSPDNYNNLKKINEKLSSR